MENSAVSVVKVISLMLQGFLRNYLVLLRSSAASRIADYFLDTAVLFASVTACEAACSFSSSAC